jgi:hypothetical protein
VILPRRDEAPGAVPEYVVNGERISVSTTTGEFNGRAD